MTVGLVGSHRVGKTSLAEAVSNETDLPLVLTSVSDVHKRLGTDPTKPMSFMERIDLQHHILDACTNEWKSARGYFVTNRTPIDLIAYTLADASVTTDREESAALLEYTNRCYSVLNDHFSTLVIVQPGIPVVEDANKITGSLSPGYMEHLNSLMFGLAYDPRCHCSIFHLNRNTLDMQDRVHGVVYAMNQVIKRNRPAQTVAYH